MRKEFVILAAIAMITVSAAVTVATLSNDQANSQQIKGLTYDVKAEPRITALDAGGNMGNNILLNYPEEAPTSYLYLDTPYDAETGFHVDQGQAVHFTHPGPFIVDGILIDAVYRNETKSNLPFAVELLDENGCVLYKLVDTPLAYFSTKPTSTIIDIPNIETNGNFTVVVYARSLFSVGAYPGIPNNRSFTFLRDYPPVKVPAQSDRLEPIMWAIWPFGRDA